MHPPNSIPWPRLVLLLSMIGLAHFNRISITVAGAEAIIPKYGIEPTQMGLVYSAYLFVYTLAMSPGGWFSDRFGPRLALFVVGAGSALFVALTGLAGILWTGTLFSTQLLLGLIVVRGLMGLVNAPTHPAGAHFVGQWIPVHQRNLVNGMIGLSACVGVSLTYYVFGKLMDRFEWTGACMIVAAATLVVALAWMFGAQVIALLTPGAAQPPSAMPNYSWEETAIQAHRTVPSPRLVAPSYAWHLLLSNRSLLLLTLSYAAVNYFQYLFFYWSQYYFELRGLSNEKSRLYSSLLTLTMGLGMASGGWLTDWVRQRLSVALVPVAGLLIGAAALLPGSFSSVPEVTLACVAVAMFSVGACEGAYWTTAVRLGGVRGGLAAGILNTGGNAGGLLAPIVTPFISGLYGWWAGLSLASGICVLGAVCWGWIDPEERLEGTSGR